MNTIIRLYQTNRRYKKIAHSVLVALLAIAAALWLVSSIPNSGAVHNTAEWPPHSHEGWPIQKTTSYSTDYTKHIQSELNYLDEKVGGFNITQLTVDGVYNTATKNAVNAYQTARNLQVDGVVGNQTWTHMEFDVFQTWPTFRHPAGVGFRYPIYSSCRKITNSTSTDIFVPIQTSVEWDSFRNNLPDGATDAAGDCAISGGGGGGGDGGDPDGGGGGWSQDTCEKMAQVCCPQECINAFGSAICQGAIC